MNRITTLTAASLGLLALAGCGNPKLVAPDDYPQLYVSPDDSNVLLFTKPGLDLSGYRKVLLEPTEIRIQDETGVHAAQDAGASEVAAYADTRLRAELSRSFELVDTPAADVLRIRFRVLDAKPTSKGQVAMMLPPFSMVNMVSPKGIFTGSVTIAGEFREGLADDMSVAFVAYGTRPGIDATVAFRPWDAAKKVVDRIAVRLARDLEGLRQD
ncbi:MAG: DUF3313 domain-containing protein [Steroidobacteraceae bacterium]|jgi:hypothetical protein|nr:DUF3313 domain-containing protein [Steroidobacteraceae bacterium]